MLSVNLRTLQQWCNTTLTFAVCFNKCYWLKLESAVLHLFLFSDLEPLLLSVSQAGAVSVLANLCHSATWLAIFSNWLISLGLCSIKSALSCQMLTVPSVFPTAKRWGFWQLKAKQVAAWSASPCSIVAAALSDLWLRSNICTSPRKVTHVKNLFYTPMYCWLSPRGFISSL